MFQITPHICRASCDLRVVADLTMLERRLSEEREQTARG